MTYLFTVADSFQIQKRGCVLVPGLSTEPGSPVVKNGARLKLLLPDGTELETVLQTIELINYKTKPDKMTLPILLRGEFKKENVPIGTDVFLLAEKPEGP